MGPENYVIETMLAGVREIVQSMTLEEKASLCSGHDLWWTESVERLDIGSWMMSDGPHGVRKESSEQLFNGEKATCFPTASALASSWDRNILRQLGRVLACEAHAAGISVLLGPAINLKRSPLCGRNFEYFSEDPVLSGELAIAYVNALQEQGIGACPKHFAANNQEHRRFSVDSCVDERTLRELYLLAFEMVVKQANPWTLMAAYNKVNGEYCTQHHRLLTEILREEWGFEGAVMSDWGAVDDRVAGLAAGMDLEMPGCNDRDHLIVEAVRQGKLDESILDNTAARLIQILHNIREAKKPVDSSSLDRHHGLARHMAANSAVLLKNNGGLLPLKKSESLAVIGELAAKPRYQGGGSSRITPTHVESLNGAFEAAGIDYVYSKGYETDSERDDPVLLEQSLEVAKAADVVVVYLGLPDRMESEGYDRSHIRLPKNQVNLLLSVSKVNSRVVVLLANGSPIEMPWLDNVDAVLEGYLGGQAIGGALLDLLFGTINPSGKLAETFPRCLEDTPAYDNFPSPQRPNNSDHVNYGEGLFIGYRHYDTHDVTPLFPFGFGLSYTTYDYTNLSLSSDQFSPGTPLIVEFDLTNIGSMQGSEIVQLYLSDHSSTVVAPDQQLKGFDKITLAPLETKRVQMRLENRDFAHFNVDCNKWIVPKGRFEIRIGASSRDIRIRSNVDSIGESVDISIHRNTLVGDILKSDRYGPALIANLRHLAEGNALLTSFVEDLKSDKLEGIMARSLPLRGFVAFSKNQITESHLALFIETLKKC